MSGTILLDTISDANWPGLISTRWAPGFPYALQVVYEIPGNFNELDMNLISTGAYQYGKVVIDHAFNPARMLQVTISVAYRTHQALKRVTLSRTYGRGNYHRIDISSPDQAGIIDNDDKLYFMITLVFPFCGYVNKLNIQAGDFEYMVSTPSITFRDLTLVSEGEIRLGPYIRVGTGSLKSSSGGINGRCLTNASLKLETITAPILMEALLETNEASVEASIDIKTHDGNISAQVHLNTPGGRYSVAVNSMNGTIDLAYVDMPESVRLKSQVSTFTSPVTVRMHRNYEGEFYVVAAPHRISVLPLGPNDLRLVTNRLSGDNRTSGCIRKRVGRPLYNKCRVISIYGTATLQL